MSFQKGDRVIYTGKFRTHTNRYIGKTGTVVARTAVGPYVQFDGEPNGAPMATFDENLEKLPEYSAFADPEVNAALRDEVAMRCFADGIEKPPESRWNGWYEYFARESYNAAEAFIAERTRRYGKEK